MRPTEVLMQQQDLAQRLDQSMFRDIVVKTVASMWGSSESDADMAATATQAAVAAGETFLVAEPMTDLIKAAADSLDSSDHFGLDMFPARSGVVRFESPLTFTDIRGSECKIHWLMWSPSSLRRTTAFGSPITDRAVTVSLWNDLSDPDDIATSILRDLRKSPDMLRPLGRWSCVGALVVPDGRRLGDPDRAPNEVDLASAAETDEASRSVGASMPEVSPNGRVANIPRLLWAMVLLMSQEIVTTSRSEHTRAQSKVLRRHGASEDLTVVTLRRRSPASAQTGSGNALDHRALTRGHWAWRHCGASHPMAQEYEKGYRARVWINPYIRGPENSPIRSNKKVYKLSR